MTKIIKKVALNAPASTSTPSTSSGQTGVDPTKGTITNPFTQVEMATLQEECTWNGGYVAGMGYIVPMMMNDLESSESTAPLSGIKYVFSTNGRCSIHRTKLEEYKIKAGGSTFPLCEPLQGYMKSIRLAIIIISLMWMNTACLWANDFIIINDTLFIDKSIFGKELISVDISAITRIHNDFYLLCDVYGCYKGKEDMYWGTKSHVLYMDPNKRDYTLLKMNDHVKACCSLDQFSYLFSRHDSIIIKAHDERYKSTRKSSFVYFCLDVLRDQWVLTESANNQIYDDENYSVYLEDRGEWGEYMEFRNKNTDKRYIYKANGRIVRHEGCYYIINTHQVMKIDDPTQGLPYQGSSWGNKKLPYTCPEPEVVMDLEELVMPKGTNIPREILRNDPLIPSPPYTFCAAFVVEGKLFLLIESQTGLYVASYQGRELTKVQDIGCRAQHLRTNGYLLRENNRQDNQAQIQVRFKKDDSVGIIDIKDYEIIVTHFVLKD